MRSAATGWSRIAGSEQGKATIVADADFLDVETLDGPTANNLNAMLGRTCRARALIRLAVTESRAKSFPHRLIHNGGTEEQVRNIFKN